MKKPHVKWFGFRYVFPAIISLIAQTFSGTVQSVSVAQTVTADSIVSIVADAQELPLIPPEEVPLAGTFWTALPDPGGGIVPMPCPPYDPNAKIWIIAEGQFLADTTTNANNLNAAALEAQGEMAMNLITQIRTMGANRQSQAMGMDVPMPGDGGESSGGEGYPGFNSTYGVDTNQLWLEISNAFNGLVSVNLHQATNLVYAIWSTTNLLLPFSDWQVETEVWSPTNQTVAPFMVSTLDRPNLFLRAQDWTGVDSDSDGIPDWWIWKFFANFSLNATNLDSTGTNTLGYDYSHGLDPNVISFDLSISNLYVNTESVRLQIDLHGGVPSYQAVLINDTNLADAAWQAYAGTNLGLILGPTDGVYAVRVGLRGLPADAQQTWQELDLTLDRVPPAITITNPASGAISQPMIQLQGYVQDSLAQITYDLSNAAGVRTGQQGFMTGLGFDPSLFAFTTNFFQCFDIMLTNGVNAIALHATDLAGNTATTNLSLTLDYSADTTPPALTVIWPPEGALVSGDSFTFAGQVDDATAKVMVMTVDAGGNTNVEEGLVERDGMVWAANLPLAAGTNWLTVTAQDVAGNTASTNWAVVQSEVLVTIQPLASDQMNQSSVTVYGTVSDGTVKLYVNGVQAGVNVDTGAWRADYVPVNSSGTALLEVKIYPAAGGGGGGTLLVQGDDFLDDTEPIGSQRVKLTQPPVVQVVGYSKQRTTAGYYYVNIGESDYMETLSAINWVEGVGGWDHEHSWVTPHYWGIWIGETYESDTLSPLAAENPGYPMLMEQGTSGTKTANAYTALKTGGSPVPGEINLYWVKVRALDEKDQVIDPARVRVPGQTVRASAEDPGWGEFLASAPGGATIGMKPGVGVRYDTFGFQSTNVTLRIIDANDGNDLTGQTNMVIVGQQMNLECQLSVTNAIMTNSPLANFQWSVPGNIFTDYVATAQSAVLYTNLSTTRSNVVFYWSDQGLMRVKCSATVNGNPVSGQAWFEVIRPEVTWTLTPKDSVAVDTNYFCDPLGDQTYCGYYRLRTGKNISTNDVGMLYQMQVTDLRGYTNNYEIQFVQIILMDWKRNIDIPPLEGSISLQGRACDSDGSRYSYRSWTNLLSGFGSDTPNDVLLANYSCYWRQDNFDCYLMFRPEGGKPVPLKVARWNWYGCAKRQNTNSPPEFSGVAPITNAQPTIGIDCFNHPDWTNNSFYMKDVGSPYWQFHSTQYPTP